MITLYHSTTPEAAQSILRDGFRDAEGTYLAVTETTYRGVWLSDRPLDMNEGAKGNTLLCCVLSIELADIEQYEWVNE